MDIIQRSWWDEAETDAKRCGWVHIFGPAKYGKTITLQQLSQEFKAPVSDLSNVIGGPRVAVFAPDVEDMGTADPKAFWAEVSQKADDLGGPYFVLLDNIDGWLVHPAHASALIDGFLGARRDLSPHVHLVTTGCFSLEAVCSYMGLPSLKGVAECSQLAAMPFPLEGDEDARDEHLSLIHWAEHDPRYLKHADDLIADFVDETDGHPGLCVKVIAIAAGQDASERSRLRIKNAIQAATEHPEALSAQLFPWLYEEPKTAELACMYQQGLEFMLTKVSPDESKVPQMAQFAFGMGLLPMSYITDKKTRAEHAPLRQMASLSDTLPDVKVRLEARMAELYDILPGLFAKAREQDTDDPVAQHAQNLAHKYFCESERGKARNTQIEGTVQTIVREKYYALTLASHAEGTPRGAEISEPTREATDRDDLRLFVGLPEEFRDLWQQEFNLLRQVSNANNLVLPDIRENGTLNDINPGQNPFGYILIRNEGNKVVGNGAFYRYYRDVANRRHMLNEVRNLLVGLVDLQKRGVVHRLINPSTMRWKERPSGHKRLIFGGFEMLTSAYMQYGHAGEATLKKIKAEVFRKAVGDHRNRIFVEPAAQDIFFETDSEKGIRESSFVPQTDVYGLCMTLCHIFYGSPSEEILQDYDAAETGPEAEHALTIAIARYIEMIRAAPCTVISAELRETILLGLEPNMSKRPTGIDLHTEFTKHSKTLYLDYMPQAKSTYVLTYNAKNALTELRNNLHYLLDFDPDADTAYEDLQRFLELRLKGATHVFRDPSGYGRFVSNQEYRNEKHDKAKIVIACTRDLNFYCDIASEDYGLPNSKGLVLVLRYALDRRNNAIAALVDENSSIEFPGSGFRLVPDDRAEIVQDEIPMLAKAGTKCASWTHLIEGLPAFDIPEYLQTAYDALQFVTEIENKERDLIKFPVTVTTSNEGHHARTIELNVEKFTTLTDRDPYLSLLNYDARTSPEMLFQLSLLEWLERNGGTKAERIRFQPEGSDSSVELKIGPNDIHRGFITINQRHTDLYGPGRLIYDDDFGIRSIYNARQEALANLRVKSDVLKQLHRPHPTMALSRKMPASFAKDLKGNAREAVWSMVNAHPIFLLQGPPGTGKTRSLSENVQHVLANEEVSAKFLVTAQTHASVDTTLMRIAETLREGDKDAGARFHLIRHLPNSGEDRVTQHVRDTYSVTSHVDRVIRTMQARSEDLDATIPQEEKGSHQSQLRQRAAEMLMSVPDHAYDEVERRVHRNASIHFTTTAGARERNLEVFGRDQEFHTAVVEEASKVWGAGIIQPLMMARKAILIGDHKQIGPFNAARYNRLAYLACSGKNREGKPIYGQYRDNPTAMTNWMETFRRLFEKYEENPDAQVTGGVRMADTLSMQFRSTQAIGDLVSRSFYDDRVVYGNVEQDTAKMLVDVPATIKGGRTHDPSLVWLNTDRLSPSAYMHQPRSDGRIENRGEINTICKILALPENRERLARITNGGKDHSAVNEHLLILSPYRSQIAAIRERLKEDPTRYGFSEDRTEALEQIDLCCTSIDAAQGMEAETVLVSCVRSVPADHQNYPDKLAHADATQWEIAIRRNFGFMTEPERINVMLSRAKQQLICVGNFDHFSALKDLIEDWADANGADKDRAQSIRSEQGFWGRMVEYLNPTQHHGQADKPSYVVDLSAEKDRDIV